MAHIVSPIPSISSIELRVGGRGHFREGYTRVLIEVAIIQVSILGADEE